MHSRRRFLWTLGMASTALGLAPRYASVARAAANSKLNVGFVGVANRAGANLAEVARETQLANVAALCDVDANFLADAAKRHPLAKTYNDFRRMLEQKDLDAVVVSTPDHTHAVAACAALKRGLHVYCEKPLARTVSEVRRITELARKHKRATQLGTQIHAEKNYRRVVELVRADAIGAIREVHVWAGAVYGGKSKPTTRPPVPAGLDWDLWLGPVEPVPYHPDYAPFAWRNWWAFGGGTLADFGCHFMDLPFWAMELKYPTSVEPVDGPPVHPDSPPPWAIVRYEHPSRPRTGSATPWPAATLTWYHGGKQPALLTAEQAQYFKSGVLFVGEKGNLLADYTRRQLLPEEKFTGFQAPPPSILDSVGHHREWLLACRGEGTTTCNFDYSGPLSEAAQLGNVAYRVNRKLVWNAAKLRAEGVKEADQYIQHHYRKGWSL